MRAWVPTEELSVFLTVSYDGFEVFKDRKEKKETWPVTFVNLNLEPKYRSQACNALITTIIPGSHDSKFFDTVQDPIVEHFNDLEREIDVRCHDGIVRNLRSFVLFVTADWPAASKLLGFSSHNAILFCRL